MIPVAGADADHVARHLPPEPSFEASLYILLLWGETHYQNNTEASFMV